MYLPNLGCYYANAKMNSHKKTNKGFQMLPTTIHEAPALESFTPLAEHQSQTPASFFDGKPILHYYHADSRVLISSDDASRLPIFSQTESSTGAEAGGVAAAIYINSQ